FAIDPAVVRLPAGGYLMNHSTYLYLIDPLGRVRHLFRHEDGPERIAEGVERVLAEDCCQPPADRKAQAP
ncbi:MAG TPA: hypothetical protein PK413_07510, partial [Thermoanaerobaculia bacterium]|nr:hypothetical protein [Thermoanaerobaculia bacterium]